MIIKCLHALLFFLTILLIFSCKKDHSIEGGSVSIGSLKDISSNCFPSSSSGNYIAGKHLSDSNILNIQVRVQQPGRYEIYSDTINGYSFRNTGYFSDTGIVSIHLIAIGTPLASGYNTFHIFYDSSTCPIIIRVIPDAYNVPAEFTLHGAPLSCTDDTVRGVYLSGIQLTDSNYIIVAVDVNSIGKYKLSTPQVNGYSFADSGIFTNTGLHFVKLLGKGSPHIVSIDMFTISGASSCNFAINVGTAIPVTNNDHFPLTTGSFWNYNISDTFSKINKGNISIGTSLYQNFEEQHENGPPIEYFFRKSDTAYYEYGSITKYTRSIQFQPDIKGDILFLKEGLHSGESWYSSEYIGNFNPTEKVYFRYYFICEDNNLSMTVNGNNFIHVYKIQMRPQLHALTSSLYNETGERYYCYYAKGVGLVDMQSIIPYYFSEEVTIRSWLVN